MEKELIIEAVLKESVSPPKWKGTVEHMKKHPEIDNPWALAWYEHGKGYKPHIKEKGRPRKK